MPASDLISRAARFFVLAEQAFRLWVGLNHRFWDLSAPLVLETALHLPAMDAVVRKTVGPVFLHIVASYALPDVLPPEAVLWHDRLVAAWEVHRASSDAQLQNIARVALVRLDGCGMPDGQQRPSRLPEWLAEAQKIASGEWRVVNEAWRVASGRDKRKRRPSSRTYRNLDRYRELQALAALAAWRPAARVITPPETLREWGAFWMQIGQSEDPVEKGIAAIALLNLPEADLRAASIPPVPAMELLHQLSGAIQVAAERKDPDYLSLLDWQPAKETTCPVAEVGKIAQTWLEITKHKNWRHRCIAWRQLIRWDWAGSLSICGMDLLPELVQAVPTEKDGSVLWELAQWLPAAELSPSTGTPGSLSQLQQLETAWKPYRTSCFFMSRAAAWLAGIRLQQAGLASEPPESFLKDYLSTVADTWVGYVLFSLAQWSPAADAPERWHRDWNAAWQQRLLDEDEYIQQVAAWALLRQSLEKEHGRLLRGAALEIWRAGTEALPKEMGVLGTAFARLQEVQTRLAAGEVVDFEEKPVSPAERHRPLLALPPGRIVGSEWQMENEKLKMENGEWTMKHQEVTTKPNHHLDPNRPSR